MHKPDLKYDIGTFIYININIFINFKTSIVKL